MFYTIIYGLVAFGVAYAAGALVRSEWGIVLAGTFAVMNGFFLTRIPNPLNIISVGTLALLTGIAMRVAQGRTVPDPDRGVRLHADRVPCLQPAYVRRGHPVGQRLRPDPRLDACSAAAASCVCSSGTLMAAPWVVVLNLWWLVPFLQAYTGGGGAESNASFTDPTNWTWAQINNQIPNALTLTANWAWYLPQYLPFTADLDRPDLDLDPLPDPGSGLRRPLAALPARRRVSIVLLGLSGVFVFLAKGLMEPSRRRQPVALPAHPGLLALPRTDEQARPTARRPLRDSDRDPHRGGGAQVARAGGGIEPLAELPAEPADAGPGRRDCGVRARDHLPVPDRDRCRDP